MLEKRPTNKTDISARIVSHRSLKDEYIFHDILSRSVFPAVIFPWLFPHILTGGKSPHAFKNMARLNTVKTTRSWTHYLLEISLGGVVWYATCVKMPHMVPYQEIPVRGLPIEVCDQNETNGSNVSNGMPRIYAQSLHCKVRAGIGYLDLEDRIEMIHSLIETTYIFTNQSKAKHGKVLLAEVAIPFVIKSNITFNYSITKQILK